MSGAIRRVVGVLRYAWASPTTALGLLLAGLAICTGGRVRRVDGVLEVHGGGVRRLLEEAVPIPGGADAMTLGHVVVGRTAASLARTRAHERAHVRQCERWGPLFVPAYLAAGAWAALRGRHPYRDNAFERACRDRPGSEAAP